MNIMFVCTGNICRSAMADGTAKKIIKEKNLKINVFSAGIYAETGVHATYNSVIAIKDYDVDLSLHKATNINDSKINEMDYIFCATNSHKNELIYRYPNLKEKIFTMKEFCNMDDNGKDLDIADPWGYSLNTYRACAAEIYICVEKIIEKIIEK